jgi:Na+/H+ antiporter NhaD/arsenite permease-like protein
MIDLAWLSVAALVLVIVLSCMTVVNPGIIALALAWAIGVYIAPLCGRRFTVAEIVNGFPTDLFLTLVGVTLLFTLARSNGTLVWVARTALRACGRDTGRMPVVFFLLSLCIASIGAGNIATAALVAPLAMAVAERARIPCFLMTLMVAHGCIAGALSPIAPTGVIANSLMARMGMSRFEAQSYLSNLAANTLVAGVGYLVFGGAKLFGRTVDDFPLTEADQAQNATATASRLATLITVAIFFTGVVCFHIHVGMGAFAAAAVLILTRVADEKRVLLEIPWGVIMMVCGVTVLTSLLEKTGGINRFTTVLAQFATHRSAPSLLALATGLVSVYSSTAGVVLPVFLPSVPDLVAKLGGGNPLALALSILIGGHLVDVSPLSTIGALCIASAPASVDRRLLFNQVLAWGLSMSLVAATGCYLAFWGW